MKIKGQIDRLALLLIGFMVLAIPLWFFNSLLKTALERTRESSMGLLREVVLQTAEQVRTQMKPSNYVKEVIRQVHREVLPGITPDLIKMRPDEDFGKEEFSADLPDKLLKSLRRHGLDAIMILVNSPEYKNGFHWYSDDLKRQCPAPKELELNHTLINYSTSSRLYLQHYRKVWKNGYNLPPDILKALSQEDDWFSYAYLSRFSQMTGVHDRVDEFFTDYFGQQSIYYYSYSCISIVNLHGAYSIIVPQLSINPRTVLKKAVDIGKSDLSVSLIDLNTHQEGFVNIPGGSEYYTKPPTEFWNHYLFSTGDREQAAKSRIGGLHIKITGYLPDFLAIQQTQYELFRLLASISLIFFFSWAMRYWLFGFNFGLSIRHKLIGILGIIVLLPILGTGVLTVLALRGSDRVIENQLSQQTMNSIKELAVANDENLLRQMVASTEIKRRLERPAGKEKDLSKALALKNDNLDWYTTWTGSLSRCFDGDVQFHYNPSKDEVTANRLVTSLLGKYFDNLGLAKIKKSGRAGGLTNTMTLGMMENYLTPEIEEASIVHESTIQREISHTADTSRASIMLVHKKSGQYELVYNRVCNNDEHIYRYLSRFSHIDPKWFARAGRYGDVSLAVRLHKNSELFMFAWPGDAILNPDMNANFERALATRDFGQSILRNNNNIEVRAWRFKETETAIIAAIGTSRGSSFAGFATSMVFPFLLGYAILLLYFITAIIAEFINGPIKIFNLGIDALNKEQYGIMIASFSGDEFSKVTCAFNEMSNALRQREMIKRYVSKKLIQEVQTVDDTVNRQVGQLVRVTMLASDIRGFTSISEKYTPVEVVEMLNSYFTLMEEAISEFGGVIDKYIGDAVQAIFYHDNTIETAALRACRAALRMREKLVQLNNERRINGLFLIDNGIGIDTGMVISGSIGSESGRKDFTVIGKITEQAAMLESQTPQTSSKILLSKETFNDVENLINYREFSSEAMELLNV